MTDEEKAEEYVRNKADEGNFDLEQFGKAYFSESSMKQAFLAGLKTGMKTEKEYVKNNAFTSMKEQGLFPFDKWHKVVDGDLPKGEKCRLLGVIMFEKEAKNRIEGYEEQEPIIPKLTTEEKCRFCINCDVDGKTCIAKIEAPFGSFVCENNEKFEPYEE